MNMSNEEFRPQKNRDPVSILSNLLLLILTLLFLWVAFTYYQDRIQAVTLNKNRYLTAEWQLLGELKAQTDKQLSEKEREIADLQRKYNELRRLNAPDQELEDVRSRLDKAKNERELILSQGVGKLSADEYIDTAALDSSLTALLEQKVKDLNHELELSEQTVEALKDEQREMKTRYNAAVQEYQTEIRKLTAKLEEQKRQQSGVLDVLQRKADMVDRIQTTDLKDINTRVLLKAIVSSPMVRKEYPQLRSELDRYLQVLSNQHHMQGRMEAYQEAVELLKGTLR